MRVPLSWLTDFVPLTAEPRAIAEALDRLGLEVEGLEDQSAEISGVKVARILEVRAHPNADKLQLCDDAELGTDVRDELGLHEVVFDLSITPNRSDAMSVAGVARDLAAHFGLPFTVPEPSVDVSGDADEITVVVDAPDRAPRFTARRVGVTM